MVKQKRLFSCDQCGASFGKWAGQCPECQAWDTLSEQAIRPASFAGYSGTLQQVQAMGEIELESAPRILTGMNELDRVLGGGLVRGSVVLIGGDPGVGKSTGLLQVCCHLSVKRKVLYVSGEESLQQIAMRARRLGLPDQDLLLLAETQVEQICAIAATERPEVMVIDSIQTMQAAQATSAPGSVSQVRESAARLTSFAKQSGIAIFLVGHVTKSGDLAGPRVLEHIIDVVCYIEGNMDSRFRIMRAVKNRFGAVNEIGVFAMTDTGLKEISNPSAIFLSREQGDMAGSVVMVVWEGSRPLLVEIQALVDETSSEHVRRITVGLEHNRLAMLLAILHKHGGIPTANQDVFINVVGGVRVNETSVDLALIMAMVSSLRDLALPRHLVVFGEMGLAGEIRPVPSGIERLKEAAKHGFTEAIVPKGNLPRNPIKGLKVHGVSTLQEALAYFNSL
ncbi:MAG: DNA repair protein RadA [Proteobacteria bacterium]|nr:DNA repair protein RadA [Pseudomonadota bacterium]MBU1639829.1 DNA repair protein RadA [Pseudomonadota bacterium]